MAKFLGGDLYQTLDDHLDWSRISIGKHPRDRVSIPTLQEELGLIVMWRLTKLKEWVKWKVKLGDGD